MTSHLLRSASRCAVLVSGFVLSFTVASSGHGQSSSNASVREKKPAATLQVKSFKGDIQPIFDANCVACHLAEGPEAALNLEPGTAYRELIGQQSVQTGMPLVSPGNPQASYLMKKLTGAHIAAGGTGAAMPPLAPLSPATIQVISAWITGGAPDN